VKDHYWGVVARPFDMHRQYACDDASFPTHDHQVSKSCTVKQTSKPTAFIAFSISNFPSELSYVDLRKGLEVCGILSDVHISRYRNVRGQTYGFACFANVRNVC